MLRAHAVWAARRLGHDDLLDAAADDPDEAVRAELGGEVAAVAPGLAGSPPDPQPGRRPAGAMP